MKIQFNNNFYSITAIKKAIKDYCGLARFSYKKCGDFMEVSINNIKNKELRPRFKQEFSNYCLSCTALLKG
jgi:hypothetical protein